MINQKSWFEKPQGVKTCWASPENPLGEKAKGGLAGGGRKGFPCFALAPGEQRILAHVQKQKGTIRRIWITISQRDAKMLRGLRLDFFWNGADTPAVSCPLGDFFGTGLGRMTAFESACFSSPEGKSFVCVIPMPFIEGMKMTVTNETDEKLGSMYYDINYTLGDAHDENTLFFHAHYRRENPTVMQTDYEILPKICGSGRWLGCNIGVLADQKAYYRSWWGEGEVKVYLDGDTTHPTLCGTGTEDYIGTGWGQGRFANLYQGCHVADYERMAYCFYRYHIPDPIFFDRDIRVTIQQIGCWDPQTKALFDHHNHRIISTGGQPIDFSNSQNTAPNGLFERCDDWSSCAYFYLDRPDNDLPALDDVQKRMV